MAYVYLSSVIESHTNRNQLVAAHLGATFAGDILISCSTAYFLLEKRRNSLKQTQSLIDTLVRVTWQSAIPAALWCAFALGCALCIDD